MGEVSEPTKEVNADWLKEVIAEAQALSVLKARVREAAERVEKAHNKLEDVSEGRGGFSRDPHEHAHNTIEDAKHDAKEVRQQLRDIAASLRKLAE